MEEPLFKENPVAAFGALTSAFLPWFLADFIYEQWKRFYQITKHQSV